MADQNADQHTPGPWTAHAVLHGSRYAYELRTEGNCVMVARRDERDANARLIAAAPDLLAALIEISHGPTTPGSNPTTTLDLARDVIGRSQEIARAAIRKATER